MSPAFVPRMLFLERGSKKRGTCMTKRKCTIPPNPSMKIQWRRIR